MAISIDRADISFLLLMSFVKSRLIVKPLEIIVIYRWKHIIKFKFHERQYIAQFVLKHKHKHIRSFSISFDNPLKLTKNNHHVCMPFAYTAHHHYC